MQLLPQSSYYEQNAFGNSYNFNNSNNDSHVSDPSPMNNNPFNNAPSEAPIFTVQELQRQIALQAQQLQGGGRQSQPQSQQSQSLGNAPNAQANSSNAPFMIMTQLPVQATPFAANLNSSSNSSGNGGMGGGSTKPDQNQQAPPAQAQAQQQQQQNTFGMSNTSFANLMEPTQISSSVQHPSSQANFQFPPQQQQQQTQSTDNTKLNASQNATSMNPSNSNSITNTNNLNTNNNNTNNSNLNNLNSATSNTYLDQLMRNAYAAQQQGEQHTLQQQQQQQLLQQQQQLQQPWQQQQSNPNPFSLQGGKQQGQGHTMHTTTGIGSANSGNMGTEITKQQQALFTLGSTAEPVSTKEPQESRLSLDLAGWKNFWDDDEVDNNDDGSDKIMPPAPAAPPSKAKRKLHEQYQPQQLQQLQLLQQQLLQQQQHQQAMAPPSCPSPSPLRVVSTPTSKHHPHNPFPQAPTPSMDCSIGSFHGETNNSSNNSQINYDNQSHNSGSIHSSNNHNNDDNDIDDDGDDFSPTPLHKIQSRHAQYQRRRDQEQQRVQQNMQCASPTMSSSSAPASIPSLQQQQQQQLDQQQANNQDPLSVSQRMLQFQMQQHQFAAQQQQQQHQQTQQQQVEQKIQQGKYQQVQAQQSHPQNPPLRQQQQIQQLQQHQQKPQKRQIKSKSSKGMKPELPPLAPAPSSSSKNQAFLLPTTMMPPSVLASVLTAQKVAHHSGNGAPAPSTKHRKKTGNKCMRVESPQDVLQRLLSIRGYGSDTRIKADQANYDTMPSALQLASFGTELVKAINSSNVEALDKLLSCGLSPNPCNQFRDSIVDLVCKRANHTILQCLVDNGCDLRVCDGFGRTPLHHSCWASEFSPEIAELILNRDWLQLLIEDKRGQTPLEYVRPDTAGDWIEFLESHQESLFPMGGCVPPLESLKELRPDGAVPDPPNSLPIQLAEAVSSGHMTPEEVLDLSPGMRERFA